MLFKISAVSQSEVMEKCPLSKPARILFAIADADAVFSWIFSSLILLPSMILVISGLEACSARKESVMNVPGKAVWT